MHKTLSKFVTKISAFDKWLTENLGGGGGLGMEDLFYKETGEKKTEKRTGIMQAGTNRTALAKRDEVLGFLLTLLCVAFYFVALIIKQVYFPTLRPPASPDDMRQIYRQFEGK
jgi:hypothetical protein